ncbi:aminoglycoside phosphotransferase family protein [Shimia sp.]|uniref:aminoglycoside phosphotransferase family protein n=1 Tax=Shimia sp. TaxID=1954381 RepID=UPI003296F200
MNMTRTTNALTVRPEQGQWHPVVRARLAGKFDAIARLVSGRKSGGALEFDVIKHGHSALSLEVRSGGRRAYLKLFDTSHTDKAYRREKASLCALRDSGLVPRILAFSDGPRFILCTWSDGASELQQNIPMGPTAFARNLGKWLADLDSAVPGETACGNWYGYLQSFGASLDMDRIQVARDVLMEIPLCGRALSRNDAALQNFVTNAEGQLMGCDFDLAQMRPRGWDFVLGHIGLIERFPDRIEEVLTAYTDGFSRAHRGALIVEELNVVARILYCARALATGDTADIIQWQ